MTEWFRHESWTVDDEREFFAHLGRSRGDRSKAQYLRIQASHLEATGKRANIVAALALVDRLVREFPDPSQCATAHWQRGRCQQALGDTDRAIESYRAALDAERRMPAVTTGARLDLAWLIATGRIRRLYEEALTLVDGRRASLSFPIDEFRESAIRALIASDQGDRRLARQFAAAAIEAAERKTSGLRHHRTLGLVGERYRDVVEQMRRWSVG